MSRTKPSRWTIEPEHRSGIGRAARLAGLVCAIVVVWSLWGLGVFAQVSSPPPPPPPPDTPPPRPTPTDTRAPTDTPTASNTPKPPKTPTKTSTPAWTETPKPTRTPTRTATPTATRRPERTPTLQPSAQPPPNPQQTAKPDPNCQSVVEGDVYDVSGQPARGATVTIEGPGGSNSMMTNDAGHYGFGGLCAGTVTLHAYLSSGQASPPARVSVNGKDNLVVDLRTLPAEVTAGAIATSMGGIAQPSPTAEPDMPATGFSGWLLVGGALLGALLLISAGARRVLGAHSRIRSDRD